MNLIFDIGNSSSKMAIFDGRVKITSFRTRELSCEKLEKKITPFKIDKAIISSVRIIPEYIFDLLTVNIPVVKILSAKSKLPFSIEYETPDTLGPDRIAAVAGAYSLFPGKNILIIDAGSAITYDFISGKRYRGGNISPGLGMRFKALHKFTGKLPLVTPAESFPVYGNNTIEAITAGVINGVIYEINEYIRTFQKNYVGIKVILTGGDSGYLKERISYKTTCVPDIVIDGLNFILEYDAK
jgi:type III pantothenate kinase